MGEVHALRYAKPARRGELNQNQDDSKTVNGNFASLEVPLACAAGWHDVPVANAAGWHDLPATQSGRGETSLAALLPAFAA